MLNEYRKQLDAIDDALVDSFAERLRVIDRISAYKREQHLDACDPNREQEMLQRLCARVPEMAHRAGARV